MVASPVLWSGRRLGEGRGRLVGGFSNLVIFKEKSENRHRRIFIRSSLEPSAYLRLSPEVENAVLIDTHRERGASVDLDQALVLVIERLQVSWDHLVFGVTVTQSAVSSESECCWRVCGWRFGDLG